MTPLSSSISVSEFILFSTAIACAGKTNSPVNQTCVCLHPVESWGDKEIKSKANFAQKGWGNSKSSQERYHDFVWWFSMRHVVQFPCLAYLLFLEVPSIHPQNSALSIMLHGQSYRSSLLESLHYFFFFFLQSTTLILLPGVTLVSWQSTLTSLSLVVQNVTLINISGINSIQHSLVFTMH